MERERQSVQPAGQNPTPPDLLESVPVSRRAFVSRLAGAAFAVPLIGSFGAATALGHQRPSGGYPGGYPGGKKRCMDGVKASKRAFEEQQKAERKAFHEQPHTKEEKRAFEERQKAARKAFHEQYRADKKFCQQLHGDHDSDDDSDD